MAPSDAAQVQGVRRTFQRARDKEIAAFVIAKTQTRWHADPQESLQECWTQPYQPK